MKKILLLCLVAVFIGIFARAQYKYDNTLYKTLFPQDLCDWLQQYPDRLILDVRSRGEHADTSSTGLNIGRLKNARNIDVRELAGRLKELEAYKNKPVLVYCSHSQRSRRSSKLLADSGFTHVININGGMTGINLLREGPAPCVNDLYETGNRFRLLTPAAIVSLIDHQKNVFILDVRADSAFRGIATEEMSNALGKLKNAVNIPFASLPAAWATLPKDRPVLVVDESGTTAIKAAKLLTDQGYNDVGVAFNGMDLWAQTELSRKDHFWQHPQQYRLINSNEFNRELQQAPQTLIVDVRTAEEFNNKVPQPNYWKNRGHIQNARNIPLSDLPNRSPELEKYKQEPIVLYALGNSPEAFKAARLLADRGFTRVQVLLGGLWDLRWKAANMKGQSGLMKWVVDVPADNL